MASLADYEAFLHILEQQGFQVNPQQCLSVRHRKVECHKCADACVSGCIKIDETGVTIHTEKCIGCGTCSTACPTGALLLTNPADAHIAEEMRAVRNHNAGQVVVACASLIEQVGSKLDGDAVVKVACLGRLDESLLVQAVSEGAENITLVAGDCVDCPYAVGVHTIEEVVNGVRVLLAAWESPARVKLTHKFPRICAQEGKATYDVQRREFLLGMKEATASTAQQTARHFVKQKLGGEEAPLHEHVTSDGTLPRHMPARRVRLAEALEQLGEPRNVMVESRLWNKVTIEAEKCNGCQMCAVFCPGGALSKHREIDEVAMQACAKLYKAPGNPQALREKMARAQAAGVSAAGVGVVAGDVAAGVGAAAGEREATGEGKTGGSANATSLSSPQKVLYKRHKNANASSSFGTGERVDLCFTPRLCLGCNMCVQVCPQGAIHTTNAVAAPQLAKNLTTVTPLKDIFREKGGPDAIRNSMSKLIDSPYLWG